MSMVPLFNAHQHCHVDVMSKKRKREPDVIVFEEPTTSWKPRRGREAAKERERFLVRMYAASIVYRDVSKEEECFCAKIGTFLIMAHFDMPI